MSRVILCHSVADPITGAVTKIQQVDADHPLPVAATVSATASTVAKATAAAPSYVEGDTEAPLSVDLAGGLRITGTINATSAATATAAAPSYVEGAASAFSQNLTGDLRVIAKIAASQTVGLAAGSALVGKVGIDQTTPGTTNAVAGTNFPTAVDVNSGNLSNSTLRTCLATNSVAIPLWGHGATGASVPANATYIGARTLSATPSDTTAQMNSPVLDLKGSMAVQPYGLGDNVISGLTAAMTGTTSTAVTGIGAPGANLFNYITTIVVGNSHATVGTFVELQDGSGGTTFFTIPAAAVYGGAVITLPKPLKQPTANTALFCKNTTTGANTIVSVAGFKGP